MRKTYNLIDANIGKLHKEIESLNLPNFCGVSIGSELHIEFDGDVKLNKKNQTLLDNLIDNYKDKLDLNDIRALRQPLLDEADWRFNRALDADDSEMMSVIKLYRKALRDITKQDLNNLQWPVKPWEPVLIEEKPEPEQMQEDVIIQEEVSIVQHNAVAEDVAVQQESEPAPELIEPESLQPVDVVIEEVKEEQQVVEEGIAKETETEPVMQEEIIVTPVVVEEVVAQQESEQLELPQEVIEAQQAEEQQEIVLEEVKEQKVEDEPEVVQEVIQEEIAEQSQEEQ